MSEVERKFRVAEVPDGLGAGAGLRQGYVAIDGDVEVRVRDEDGGHTVTVKGGSGLERTEVEVPLDPDRFEELWALSGERRIEKIRHRLPLGDGLTAELDLYGGRLDGLAVVEVEFPDRATADGFTPPAWFGDELTGQAGWSNAALATHGAPSADPPSPG
jgi:CYTH domain-containing protein